MISDLLSCIGVSISGFVDDNPSCTSLDGFPVFNAKDGFLLQNSGFRFIVAIGDNRIRASTFQRLVSLGGTPLTVVHPNASVSKRATIGPGTVVMAGAIVNSGAVVGVDCILNTACSVDHDSRLGDHVHICPGARLAGSVRVGEQTMVGTGCCVVPGKMIGCRSVVGAGAVVISDLPDYCCAYGNPARVQRFLKISKI